MFCECILVIIMYNEVVDMYCPDLFLRAPAPLENNLPCLKQFPVAKMMMLLIIMITFSLRKEKNDAETC